MVEILKGTNQYLLKDCHRNTLTPAHTLLHTHLLPLPFTQSHPARISSPTCPVLGALRVLWTLTRPPGSTFAHCDTLLLGLPGHRPANTKFPIICSFAGRREEGAGPGRGLGEQAAPDAERRRWPGLGGGCCCGVEGANQREEHRLIQPGARGPRVHLSSHYCNKSGLHYMKGKMNYRR